MPEPPPVTNATWPSSQPMTLSLTMPREPGRRYGTRSAAPRALVQPVQAHRAPGHDLVLGLGRQAFHAIHDHFRGAGEEAVRVRVVGPPQDLVGPDVIGQRLDAALDRLERDPTIALEQFARPRRQTGIVKALIVEMPVHAVEPRGDPSAARFEKGDADLRMALAHPAPNHAH